MTGFDPHALAGTMDALGAKGLVGTLAVGFLAGVVAKILMPGKDPGGLILTSLLGIAGSTLATFLGHHYGWYAVGRLPGFVAAVGGAFLILLAYRLISVVL